MGGLLLGHALGARARGRHVGTRASRQSSVESATRAALLLILQRVKWGKSHHGCLRVLGRLRLQLRRCLVLSLNDELAPRDRARIAVARDEPLRRTIFPRCGESVALPACWAQVQVTQRASLLRSFYGPVSPVTTHVAVTEPSMAVRRMGTPSSVTIPGRRHVIAVPSEPDDRHAVVRSHARARRRRVAVSGSRSPRSRRSVHPRQ